MTNYSNKKTVNPIKRVSSQQYYCDLYSCNIQRSNGKQFLFTTYTIFVNGNAISIYVTFQLAATHLQSLLGTIEFIHL